MQKQHYGDDGQQSVCSHTSTTTASAASSGTPAAVITAPAAILTTPTSDAALLTCNSSTRIRSRDAFMLMALWMERCPRQAPLVTSLEVRPTGCVLVDPRDRVLVLESTGEAHAIVRAILQCVQDPRGCDIYVSRFPCAMCVKVMVQAGIRKVYYFPADKWEVDWEIYCRRIRNMNGLPESPSRSLEPTLSASETQPIISDTDMVISTPQGIKRANLDSVEKRPSPYANSLDNSCKRPDLAVQLLQPDPVSGSANTLLKETSIPTDLTTDHSTEYAYTTYLASFSSARHQREGSSSPRRPPSTLAEAVYEKRESNHKSVRRLISNNPIAMSLYIPQWDHSSLESIPPKHTDSISGDPVSTDTYIDGITAISAESKHDDPKWVLDVDVGSTPALSTRWPMIVSKFDRTIRALRILHRRFAHAALVPHTGNNIKSATSHCVHGNSSGPTHGVEMSNHKTELVRHAMVLAHVAAKRTDDPKVGVGAVLIDPRGRYVSIGWNGYPKKAAHLDYPQSGADDSVEDEELKYDYSLHAEQNALLWRSPPGLQLAVGTTIVTTKMPCDECSPVIADCGVSCVVSIPQTPKSVNDSARYRGLTYEKLKDLIADRWVFEYV
ncbi:hypothetical protein BASA60_001864 [Batrachochytrium salamandrivorans]|nr:hypothetical protein BASA60_001864 [Batrachochytrium salamandrivorans]